MNKQTRKKFSFDAYLNRIREYRTAVILYLVLTVILFLCCGLIIFLDKSAPAWLKLIQLFGITAVGCFSLSVIVKKFSFLQHMFYQEVLYTILFPAAISYGLLSFIYSVFPLISALFALAGAACFLLPSFIYLSFTQLVNIPPKQYKSWTITDDAIHEPVLVDPVKIEVKFKLKKNRLSGQQILSLQVLRQSPIGNGFHYLIKQHEPGVNSIDWLDDNNNPYKWNFYVERLWGLKKVFLHPLKSFRRNNIKENDIIVAKRQLI